MPVDFIPSSELISRQSQNRVDGERDSAHAPSAALPFRSASACNKLGYLLARDALHSLAAAARQAPPASGDGGGVLNFENTSGGGLLSDDIYSSSSNQVMTHFLSIFRIAFSITNVEGINALLSITLLPRRKGSRLGGGQELRGSRLIPGPSIMVLLGQSPKLSPEFP